MGAQGSAFSDQVKDSPWRRAHGAGVPDCLKVIKMLFPWYLRDWPMCPMCHAFPFPSSFPPLPSLHPFLSASGFHYLLHSLHFYAGTFLLPHFHPPCLLSLICIPNSLSQTWLFPSCLSLRLAANVAAPSPLPLSPPTHTFFHCCVYPTQLPPHFPWKSVLFSLLWSLFQILPVRKSQLHKSFHHKLSKLNSTNELEIGHPHLLPGLEDCTVVLVVFFPNCAVLLGWFDAFADVLTASCVVVSTLVVDAVVAWGVVVFDCGVFRPCPVSGRPEACGCLTVVVVVVVWTAASCFGEILLVGGVFSVSSPEKQ